MTESPDGLDTIEYAIRYCMGRNSYAFNDGLSLANENWYKISDATKRDVLDAVRHNNPGDLRLWPSILAARFPNQAIPLNTAATPAV